VPHSYFFFIACALVAMPRVTNAADLSLLCAGGFRSAMEELAPAFEKASGHTLKVTYGTPANTKAAMLKESDIDVAVVIAATLADVEAAGHIAPGTRFRVAESLIGLGVAAGAAKPKIDTVEALRGVIEAAHAIGLSDPAAGTNLAPELLEKADRVGLGAAMRDRATYIKGPGSVVSAAVAKGEADLVITLASEILPIAGVQYVGPLPAELQVQYAFDAVEMTGARDRAAAKAFLDFMRTPDVRALLVRKGLSVAD
jgi:molybdate transport system substrate-binding protein